MKLTKLFFRNVESIILSFLIFCLFTSTGFSQDLDVELLVTEGCTKSSSIAVRVGGVLANYIIEWNGPTDGIRSMDNNFYEITELETGNYTIFIKNTGAVELFDTTFKFNIVNDLDFEFVGCKNNDSLRLEIVNGTAPYTISYGSNIVTTDTNTPILSLANITGSFQLVVRDKFACNNAKNFDVFDVFDVLLQTTGSCNENMGSITGMISTVIASTYDISWTGPSSGSMNTDTNTFSITDLPAGEYEVEVKGENTCDFQTFAGKTIIEFSSPTPTITGDFTICEGGTAELAVDPNFSRYEWFYEGSIQDTVATIIIDQAGTYIVEATDENGCIGQSEAFEVEAKDAGEINIIKDITACSDSNRILRINGMYEDYKWSTGDTMSTLIASVGAAYSVTVTNKEECARIDSINLTPVPTRKVDIDGMDTICKGTTQELKILESFPEYNWSTGENNQRIIVNSGGSYNVTITTTEGCTITASREVLLDSIPDFTILQEPFCYLGDSTRIYTNIDLNNSYTYQWSTEATDTFIYIKSVGSHALTITNDNGCSNNRTIDVTKLPEIKPIIEGNDIICEDSPATLTVTSAFTSYQWGNGETTPSINIDSTGIYMVTVTDSNGCIGIGSKTVTTVKDSTKLSEEICAGETYDFGRLTIRESGRYIKKLINRNGCDSIILLDLIVLDSIYTITTVPLCFWESFTIQDTTRLISVKGCDSLVIRLPEYSGEIIDNPPIDTFACMAFEINDTIYKESGSIVIRSVEGCDSIITRLNLEIYSIMDTINVFLQQDESIDIGGEPYPAKPLDTLIQLQTTTGCDSTIYLKIRVKLITQDCISPLNCCDPTLYIDGLEKDNNNTLKIINRWGETVYESKNYYLENQLWNGKHYKTNKDLPAGTYYYIFNPNLKIGTETGAIYIIR